MNWLIIAKHTFKGSIRQPFFIVIIAIYFIISCSLPLLSQFAFYQQNKLILDCTTGLTFFMTILLGVFAVYELYTKEISGELLNLIFSKPISFLSYFFGKLLGIISCNFLFIIITLLITVHIQRTVPDSFKIDISRLVIFIFLGLFSLLIGQAINYFAGIHASNAIITSFFILLSISTLFTKSSFTDFCLLSQYFYLIFNATTIITSIILAFAVFKSLPFLISIAIISILLGSFVPQQSLVPQWSHFLVTDLFFKNNQNLSKLIMTSTITMFYYCAFTSIIALFIFKIKKSERGFN